MSGQSLFSNPGAETESVLVTRTSVPQHAYKAFELLSRSPEAQVLTELHLLDISLAKMVLFGQSKCVLCFSCRYHNNVMTTIQ